MFEGRQAAWLALLVALSSCGSGPEDTPRVVDSSSIAPQSFPSTGPDISTTPVEETSSGSTAPPSTSIAPTSVAVAASWPLAEDVLAVMVVAPEYTSGYDRELFPHWTVVNGCSTRDRVLIEESTTLAQVDPFGCRVVAGDWLSPFDGRLWDDPAEIQIDHLVALKEAWESGAWAWTEAERRAFANDLDDRRPLNAVTGSVNQSKSDLEPHNWMPPSIGARCTYLADWIAVKARWQLTMDAAEMTFLRSYLPAECPGQRVEPWVTVAVTAQTPPVSTVATTSESPGDVYYANCTEARAAGVTPIRVGEPGYRIGLDRDKDGVACE